VNRRASAGCLAALLLGGGPAGVAQAPRPPETLVRAADELVGELVDRKHPGITSFLLEVGGVRVADFVSPELERGAPDLRSATKSITALLVGIAIDRGEIASVDAKVVDLLPELAEAWKGDDRKRAMTVEHLLTMRSGLDCDDWNPKSPGFEDAMYETRDWLAFWAKQPMAAPPGERYSYCTGNAIALGKIVAAAAQQPLDRYAETHLFGPLGIAGATWERWNRDREIDSGGHLRLAPRDLLKIGRLVLDRGETGGRRIVSAAWIDAMTAVRSAVPDRPQSYGYLWWLDRTKDPKLPATRLQFAWGNGGNFLIVLPEIRAVAVFTGTRFNKPEALEPMFWLRDRLLAAIPPPDPPTASGTEK
jgi:CubicO group peptidase (beta-lactamase class C family)